VNIKQYISTSLIKHSLIYTTANVVNFIIPFLLIPFLTNHLTPYDYGIVSMFSLIQTIITPVLSLNINAPIQRKYFDTDDISSYVGNSLALLVVINLTYLLFVELFDNLMNSIVQLPKIYFFCIGFIVLFNSINNILLTLYQVKKKSVNYVFIQITTSLINFLFTIFFVLILKMSWDGRIISMIISSVLVGIFSFILLIQNGLVAFNTEKEKLLYLIKFGGGLIPHALGSVFISMTGRYFISQFLSLEETGLYSLAVSISSILTIFTLAFNNSFSPWLFQKLKDNYPYTKNNIVKLTYAYFTFLIILGVFYYLSLPLLYKYFIGPKFTMSIKYCLFLILGSIFQGMYFMVANYIIYAEKSIIQSYITLLIGLINIPITFFAVKFYGGIGASIAYSISFFLFFVFTWILSNFFVRMPWLSVFKY
jgi:O-antigen/teichoic acid export membrane protein